MRARLIFIILLGPVLSFCQNGVNLFYNTVTSALGGSNVAYNSDLSGSINPACMTWGKGLYASLGAQRSFLIEDINQGNFDLAYRMKNGSATGLQLYYFGNKVYNETMASLAYSVSLAEQTSLGLRLHGIRFSAPENDAAYAVTFTLGGQTMISPQLGVGLTTFNPVGFFRKGRPNDLTSNIRLGISYHPAEYLSLFLSGTLDDAHPMSVAGGIAYNVRQKVYIYFSAMANPAVISVGIGIPLGRSFRVDLAGAQHLQLGLSPAFNLTYSER